MILTTVAGIPVVAAVATSDQLAHLVHCPFCGLTHQHGGHGRNSQFGAVDGGRMSHCLNTDHGQDVMQAFGSRREAWYVLKEVRGRALLYADDDRYGWKVTYDRLLMADLNVALERLVEDYEAEWGEHIRNRGCYIMASELKAAAAAPSAKRCAVYLHYDADDVLLYVGIANDVVTRGRAHAAQSVWVPFAVRGEHVWCDDRTAAALKEVELIRTRRPLFNETHAAPGRDRRVAEYLAGKGRLDLLALAI